MTVSLETLHSLGLLPERCLYCDSRRCQGECFQTPFREEGPDRCATPGEAHSEWHRNVGVPMGTPGCPQDACHLPDEGPYDEEPEPVYTVQTPYGTETFLTYTEAKVAALSAAKITGKACKVVKV